MLHGVYIPPGADPKLVAALEKFAEQLIEPVADLLWDGDSDPEKARAANTGESERILGEELARFLTYGDWKG